MRVLAFCFAGCLFFKLAPEVNGFYFHAVGGNGSLGALSTALSQEPEGKWKLVGESEFGVLCTLPSGMGLICPASMLGIRPLSMCTGHPDSLPLVSVRPTKASTTLGQAGVEAERTRAQPVLDGKTKTWLTEP